MLIGIDASRALKAQRTGTERYALELIRRLIVEAPQHHFRLYLPHQPPARLFAGDGQIENCTLRVLPAPRLWTHTRLAAELSFAPPDVFFEPAHVLPWIYRGPTVVTVHDLGFHYFPAAHPLFERLYLDWTTRRHTHVATTLLADSEATRQDLVRVYGTPSQKIQVVYPGADQDLVPEERLDMLQAVWRKLGVMPPFLLFIGTLQPRKNLVRLMEAFRLLLLQNRPLTGDGWRIPTGSHTGDLSLVLAGKSTRQGYDLAALSREWGLADKVQLTGYIDDTERRALLSSAAVFTFPSLYEGFGFPVLEAMACATPVLCSHSSSLPEVAGDAARTVDAQATEAIGQGILDLLTQADLRATYVERGRAQVKKFTWQAAARQAIGILEAAAGQAVAAPR
ncbi:MAG: glycosyltransferase family 1 protein [Chloroflexi bacterium]|nr:glycosyltransferase family 1 protein [Chloroflexota bacterium]